MLFNYEMLRKGNKENDFKIKIRSLYFFKIYSSKYKVIGKKKSNFSPYRLICFNSLECFLYNNNLIFFLRLYIPIFRILGFLFFMIIKYIQKREIYRIKL